MYVWNCDVNEIGYMVYWMFLFCKNSILFEIDICVLILDKDRFEWE